MWNIIYWNNKYSCCFFPKRKVGNIQNNVNNQAISLLLYYMKCSYTTFVLSQYTIRWKRWKITALDKKADQIPILKDIPKKETRYRNLISIFYSRAGGFKQLSGHIEKALKLSRYHTDFLFLRVHQGIPNWQWVYQTGNGELYIPQWCY